MPEDTAGIALFLASELSAYVIAEAILVGGGLPQLPHCATISGWGCLSSKFGK